VCREIGLRKKDIMNSCSSILVLFVVATINNPTSAFVLPNKSITPSLFRTKVANKPTLFHESTEVNGPTKLYDSTVEEDIIPSVEEKVDPRVSLEPGRHDDIDYSVAFPSLLKRPPNLDGSHAGDYGFDPLNLSEEYDLYYMQECELRHARLAMLAVVGWPMSELIAPSWMLRENGCAPSVLNGFNPLTFLFTVAAFGAFGFLEYSTSLRRTKGTKFGDTHSKDMELIWKYGVAGDYNWDPKNLYSSLGDDAAGRKGLRTLEITQGRYAMLGITYFVLWEAMTHSPIVNNNIFFHPNLALPFLGIAYFAWSQIFQFRPISEMLKNEQIKIEYTKDGELVIQDWARLTKGPRDDLAIKFKDVTGGIELPKELIETGSKLGTSLENLIKDLKDDGKVTTTSLAGGVAGLTIFIATALSNPFGGVSNKPTPPAGKKVVPTTVTTPKKPSPILEMSKSTAPPAVTKVVPTTVATPKKTSPKLNVDAPEMPKFTAPELPKFTAPELPKFTAPELPKFAAPEASSSLNNKLTAPKFDAPELPKVKAPDVSVPKFTAPELSLPKSFSSEEEKVKETKTANIAAPELPKFDAPKLPKFTAPELPKFKAPDVSVPKFTAPEVKIAADPVIVKETKTVDIDAVIKATPPPSTPGTVVKDDSPKFDAPVLPKFAAPELPKFAAPKLPKFTAPDISVPKFTAPELSLPKSISSQEESNSNDEKEVADPVIVKETKTADIDAVIKVTPAPPSPGTVAKEDTKAAVEESRKATVEESRKAAQEQRERAAEEYAQRRADLKAAAQKQREQAAPAQEQRERATEEYAQRRADSKVAAQEARERAAEEYAQRRADSKAALEASNSASRKAAEERRGQAVEEFAKRKAENRAALDNIKAEQVSKQASRESERATKYEELSKAMKANEATRMEDLEEQKAKSAAKRADTQANFKKRSYFGDSTVMGDGVQGGKLLPKEEVSPEVKEILKLYSN